MKESITFPGLWADKKGDIYSTRRNYKGGCKKLSKITDNGGYYYIHTKENKKGFNIKVHKIAADCFLGKIPKGLVINHKDGNKLNNNINNLEYCTRSENTKHAFDIGLMVMKPERILSIYRWRLKNGKDVSAYEHLLTKKTNERKTET